MVDESVPRPDLEGAVQAVELGISEQNHPQSVIERPRISIVLRFVYVACIFAKSHLQASFETITLDACSVSFGFGIVRIDGSRSD